MADGHEITTESAIMAKTRAGLALRSGDALIIVDVQIDFLPGGRLAVPAGDEVVGVLNEYIQRFRVHGLPIFATRDWHPPNHCSFDTEGGIWPPHCIAETEGAAFAPTLALPSDATIISKATVADIDAYSGFEGTDLGGCLNQAGVTRVFVAGLATDYCVLNTVKDATRANFEVVVLTDAIRAVDVRPGDGEKAIDEMRSLGAEPATLDTVAA